MAMVGAMARRISGAIFGAIVLAAAVLIFVLIWVIVAPESPFAALLGIGFVALVFGFLAFLLEAALAEPTVARAASWGFLAMGFVVIFLTLALYPTSPIGLVVKLILALFALVLLAIAVGGFYWRSRAAPEEAARNAAREAWRAQPVANAFDYRAAHPPASPPARPPSSGGT